MKHARLILQNKNEQDFRISKILFLFRRGREMRILFVGDVVGLPGQEMIQRHLGELKRELRPQLTIVNGENAAPNGRGITKEIYKKLLQEGADVVTLGNHAWDQKETKEWIDDAKKIVRPLNYPVSYGQGSVVVNVNGVKVQVINAQGRTFMLPLDDPFLAVEKEIEREKEAEIIFVDFHAETTSEKQAFAHYFDGRVTAVCGTHTHVQTNDARCLPKGTAYVTDVGMTGPEDGILGMKKEPVIERFLTNLPQRFEVETLGTRVLSYAVIDIDDKTKQAKKIQVQRIVEPWK